MKTKATPKKVRTRLRRRTLVVPATTSLTWEQLGPAAAGFDAMTDMGVEAIDRFRPGFQRIIASEEFWEDMRNCARQRVALGAARDRLLAYMVGCLR